MTTENNSEKNNKGLVIGLAVGLLISVGLNAFLFINGKAEVEAKQVQYDKLSAEHNEVNALFEDAKALTQKLEGDVAEKDEEIQSKLAEIERIKAENDSLIASGMNKEELNRRLKANLAMVRKLNKQLEAKVDELLLENKKLETKNEALTTDLDSVNTVNDKLSEKVAIASALQVPTPTIASFKKRNSSSKPWKKTSLARRTDKIEVKATIMANEITEKGEKTVLLKITQPNGTTLGKLNVDGGDVEVQANGTVTYAAKKTFTYTGAQQDVVLEFVSPDYEFTEGNYTAEIMIEGEVVSTSIFSLK